MVPFLYFLRKAFKYLLSFSFTQTTFHFTSLAGVPPGVIATTTVPPRGQKPSTVQRFGPSGKEWNSFHEIPREGESESLPEYLLKIQLTASAIDRTLGRLQRPSKSGNTAGESRRSFTRFSGRLARSPFLLRSSTTACKTKATFSHEATFLQGRKISTIIAGGWSHSILSRLRLFAFLLLFSFFPFFFFYISFFLRRCAFSTTIRRECSTGSGLYRVACWILFRTMSREKPKIFGVHCALRDVHLERRFLLA